MKTSTLIPSDSAQALNLAGAAASATTRATPSRESPEKFIDIAGAAAGGIERHTVLQTPELRVVLFIFAAKQELAAHASPHRALVQVLDGACEFFHNGKWQRLESGSLLHLPPNHTHAARATFGKFSMLLTLGASATAKHA